MIYERELPCLSAAIASNCPCASRPRATPLGSPDDGTVAVRALHATDHVGDVVSNERGDVVPGEVWRFLPHLAIRRREYRRSIDRRLVDRVEPFECACRRV